MVDPRVAGPDGRGRFGLALADKGSASTSLQAYLRANGDYVVGASLTGCLVVPDWTLGVLIVFILLQLLSSRFQLVPQSARDWNPDFHRSFRGMYANVRIAQAIVLLLLMLYHDDQLREMETPAKVVLANFVIAMNLDRFRWSALIGGVAIGAICTFAFGMFQIGVELSYRSAGATGAVRFGTISVALAAVCATGFLYAGNSRGMATLSAAGFLAGIGAAFASGSRGAVLALPFALVALAPVLWRRSVRGFVAATAFLVALVAMLFLMDVGGMSTRFSNAYTNIVTRLADTGGDPSFGERARLLMLAYELFSAHPIAGAGVNGWNVAAEKLAAATDADDGLLVTYNQAHNQYADDLAKGGLIRFLLGLAAFLLPLYCFLKCAPYSNRESSRFALAGLVVTITFMTSCLTESLMLLSVSAVVHSVLTTFLLAACDQVREKPAAG